MPETRDGYRVGRLQRRRRGKVERWQTWVLVGLAAVVAFVAVMGAWRLGAHWLNQPAAAENPGYLVLLTLTSPTTKEPVAAALAVRDPVRGTYALFVVPRDLIVLGPQGEYVFVADAMQAGTLKQDLQRVIHVPVDAAYTLPLTALETLSGRGKLRLTLPDPVTIEGDRHFADGAVIDTSEIPQLFAGVGPSGYDAARLQKAIWKAVLGTAALRTADTRRAAVSAAVALQGSADSRYLRNALTGLTEGSALVDRLPSFSRVADGQFAFHAKADEVMAAITRMSSTYHSRYTVLVRNGTGQVGIGAAVAQQLAILDVNLPPATNADQFGYRQTRILAGRDALPVAQEVRAILGRGVVLDGSDLPPDTVVVIVGGDTKLDQVKAKDQP